MSIASIIIYLFNFVLIIVVLDIILYKPVSKYLQKRSERIKGDLEQAEEAKKQAGLLQIELEEKLKNSDQIVLEAVDKARNDATLEAKAIVDSAREEAQNILSQAQTQAEQERNIAIKRMRDELAQVAIALAEKILEREVNEKDNQAVIDEFFKEVV